MGVCQSPLFRRDTSISSVIRFLSEPIYGVGPAALGLGVQTFKFQIQPGPLRPINWRACDPGEKCIYIISPTVIFLHQIDIPTCSHIFPRYVSDRFGFRAPLFALWGCLLFVALESNGSAGQ